MPGLRRLVRLASALLLPDLLLTMPAAGEGLPTIETETSELGSVDVGDGGRVHPLLAVDLRNGDFVRGDYDDDGADLSRVPVHVQFGVGAALHHTADGRADLWLVARSSNGLHAPRSEEGSPRAWYESNNVVGLVGTLAPGLRGAIAYVIKTSPNGVASTTHEASISAAFEREDGIGALRPTFVATVRPKGDGGVYTQAGIAPQITLGPGDDAPSFGVPAHVGVGWGGFYGPRTGDVLYGDVGLTYAHPVRVADIRCEVQAEVLALIRDRTLRRLGRQSSAEAETAAVVPQVRVSLSVAF